MSLPESEETDEAEDEDDECCWGLDIRESALCGDAESLCCSSESPPNWTTVQNTKKFIALKIGAFFGKTLPSFWKKPPLTAAIDYGIVSLSPLLDDPLPVVDHLLGQSEDPAECAEGDRACHVHIYSF